MMLSTRSIFYTGPEDLPREDEALLLWASGSDSPEVFTYQEHIDAWENHCSVTPDKMLSFEDEPEAELRRMDTGEARGLPGLIVRRLSTGGPG